MIILFVNFLFITYFLYFFLSWASYLRIYSSDISASTLYNHVLAGLPTGLLDSTLYSILFFTPSSSLFLITCSYHLILPLLMTVVIGSTPTNSPYFSLVLKFCLSWKHHPSIKSSVVYLCFLNIHIRCADGEYLSLLGASHLHVSIRLTSEN